MPDHSYVPERPQKLSGPLDHVLQVLHILEKTYPDAHCALHFNSPFQLLVATILSAQCTDIRVNLVTERLFLSYPDADSLAEVDQTVLEDVIRSTGFFRNKAHSLIACARMIRDRHNGQVPSSLEELTELPGVGRKTANVVLGNAFQIPGMVVDTHVKRISFRLGWTKNTDPNKIEMDLGRILPEKKWVEASHLLIFHGRRICKAPVPICSECPVAPYCPKKGLKKSR
ncbi:MAG: endonuclease III [Deltaproteobacteria bacterium]|nr:endonuclease III [Deltaproteobacteria bacterium]